MIIHDKDGNEIADIALSERNMHVLEDDGARVVVLFHKPRMLDGEPRGGSFHVRRFGARVLTDDVAALKEYVAMRGAIAELRRRVLREP